LFQENCLFELRDNRLPTSVPARNTHCLIVNTTKLVLSLCPLLPQGSNERETLRQFVHFLLQLLHAAGLNVLVGLRHQDVESSSTMIAQGKWRQVWRMALAGQPISRQSVSRIPQLHASAPQQRKRNMLMKMLINAPLRGQRLQGLQDSVSGNDSRMQ
jgi:muconolactone delta-isomerase